MVLDVEESFDHEVLSLVDEALACFLDLAFRVVGAHTAEFYVVSRRDLPLFLYFLALNLIAHFVTVCESVIFADFA